MPYTPTKGVIENGRTANADDVMNEFVAISGAIENVEKEITEGDAETLSQARAYTNEQVGTLNVDGGTF